MMAFKKQSVSEMWFWMTESHLRTVTVHFSVMRCKKQVIPLCVK
jgi:hypothetical protein